MDTLDVVEALIWRNAKLRKVFITLDVINERRVITPQEHREFSNLLADFQSPIIIDVVGLTECIAIIEPKRVNRTFPTVIIEGHECKIGSYSRSALMSILRSSINGKDFLPPPLTRKIIYIDKYDSSVDGVVFSEVGRNLWTLDPDPLSLNLKTSANCTSGIILSQLLDFEG